MNKAEVLDPVSNDAATMIEFGEPYTAIISVAGVAPFLFHRWSVDGVEAKSKAAKGSKAKKEDDLESYGFRPHAAPVPIMGKNLLEKSLCHCQVKLLPYYESHVEPLPVLCHPSWTDWT